MRAIGLNLGHDAGVAYIDRNTLTLFEVERIAGVRHICGGHSATADGLRFALASLPAAPLQAVGVVDYVSSRSASIKAVVDPVLASPEWAPANPAHVQQMVKSTTAIDAALGICLDARETWVVRHHWAHACLAWALAGRDRVLVVVLDGTGALAESGLIAIGEHERLHPLALLSNAGGPRFGLIYESLAAAVFGSPFAAGKLMGLAAYGRPRTALVQILSALLAPQRTRQLNPQLFDPLVEEELASARIRVGGEWFDYDLTTGGFRESLEANCGSILDVYGRSFPTAVLAQGEYHELCFDPRDAGCADLAATVQHVFETALLRFLRGLREAFPEIPKLAFAGGCALNILANSRIRDCCGFESVMIPSCCDDSGVALGAAVAALHATRGGCPEGAFPPFVEHRLACAGPLLDSRAATDFRTSEVLRLDAIEQLLDMAAEILCSGKVLAWVDGRSETGPRALGHRSILANPLIAGIRVRVSERIKGREWFRPVAASCPVEAAREIFDGPFPHTPTMLFAWKIRTPYLDRLREIAHADGTVRLQTVAGEDEPLFHQLLVRFGEKAGLPVLVNTSLNRAGRPIANSLAAIADIFNETPLDGLVLVDRLEMILKRNSQGRRPSH